MLEADLDAEHHAARGRGSDVLAEFLVHLVAAGIEAGVIVDGGELRVVEGVVGLQAELQRAAAVRGEGEILVEGDIEIVYPGSGEGELGGIADAQFSARGRVHAGGARPAVLPAWYDVDTPDDWRMLVGHIRALALAGSPLNLAATLRCIG